MSLRYSRHKSKYTYYLLFLTKLIYVYTQVSEDEITFLTRGDDPYDDNVVLNKLFHPNLKLLLVSEGPDGCRYYTQARFFIF